MIIAVESNFNSSDNLILEHRYFGSPVPKKNRERRRSKALKPKGPKNVNDLEIYGTTCRKRDPGGSSKRANCQQNQAGDDTSSWRLEESLSQHRVGPLPPFTDFPHPDPANAVSLPMFSHASSAQ